jgi:hypothetical protein
VCGLAAGAEVDHARAFNVEGLQLGETSQQAQVIEVWAIRDVEVHQPDRNTRL